jgi:hypothetical protein
MLLAGSATEFAKAIVEETGKWTNAIKSANIKSE